MLTMFWCCWTRIALVDFVALMRSTAAKTSGWLLLLVEEEKERLGTLCFEQGSWSLDCLSGAEKAV
jgi:hypothetical protein